MTFDADAYIDAQLVRGPRAGTVVVQQMLLLKDDHPETCFLCLAGDEWDHLNHDSMRWNDDVPR